MLTLYWLDDQLQLCSSQRKTSANLKVVSGTTYWPATMAGLRQLNSFIGKCVSLWQAGLDASLELKTFQGEASAHIHLGLGQAPCVQKTHQQPRHVPSPSCVRRTARRAEARRLAAEGAAHVEGEHAEEATENTVTTVDEAGNALGTSDAAAVAVGRVNATLDDEVCPNAEYFPELENIVQKKCTIQLIPVNQGNIELFRDNI